MKNSVLRHDAHCRICNGNDIETVIKLESTPLEDQFVTEDRLALHQPVYPLELALCKTCGYLYLPYIVSPEASYSDYVYVSGVTVGLRSHYDEYAETIISTYSVPEQSLIIDLGSNDGSMLASFKKLGMRTLGVEPATAIAEQANSNGLTTINDFFTASVAEEIAKEYGKAAIITANYMYANIDDVIEFTRNVRSLLSDKGVFIVQTGYHPEQMKVRMFDYIYHEHFSYFTAKAMTTIFEKCGLQLISTEKTAPKGGSLRAAGQMKDGPYEVDSSVTAILEEERQANMHEVETYKQFELEIDAVRTEVLSLLKKLKGEGKSIVAFGASHSTTTLLYHFSLSPYFDYIVDDNKLKHGRYSPGKHIPVYSSSRLYEDKPDYVLVLAWQHSQSILDKHRAVLDYGGKFIFPLPECRIVDAI